MYRNIRSSFVIAAALSLTVHAATAVYFGYYHARDTNTDQLQSAVNVIQISLAPTRPAVSTPAPAAPPLAENKVEPDPPPLLAQNKVEPDPPPRLTASPARVVRREPLPQSSNKPRPASSKAPETVEPVEQQTVAVNSTEAAIDKPAPARAAQENDRESYLAQLLSHIDRHKFYPRSARRRGMQGEVQVAFYLHKDGSFTELQVSGGSKVLRKAAKQALQQALSLPLPPASMPLQEQIRFGMLYRLDG